MPERIPGLDQLADEAKEVTMLPASEIRHRGNRRRTTRRVAAGTIVGALLLTAGVGLWQSPLLDQFRDPQWATTAVPETPEPTVIPPTWDNAPTAEMLFPDDAPGEIKAEYEGPGQAAKGLCDPGEYGEPTVHLTREFGAPGDYPAYLDATVFGYDSPEAASRGFALIRDAALNCAEPMATRSGLTDPRVADETAELPFDASAVTAQPTDAAYVRQAGLIPDSDDGMWGATLVVQAGERVLWITRTVVGMDDNCVASADDPDVMQCQEAAALPEALEALTANR